MASPVLAAALVGADPVRHPLVDIENIQVELFVASFTDYHPYEHDSTIFAETCTSY